MERRDADGRTEEARRAMLDSTAADVGDIVEVRMEICVIVEMEDGMFRKWSEVSRAMLKLES